MGCTCTSRGYRKLLNVLKKRLTACLLPRDANSNLTKSTVILAKTIIGAGRLQACSVHKFAIDFMGFEVSVH